MIRFHCKNCGQKLNVEDKHSGKQVKCPKCGSVGVVPDNSDKIKFHCQNCGQSIRVPQIYAGKKGKCPKCKNPVVVPSLKRKPADGAGTVSVTCSMCDETIQVPETSRGQTIECPECGSYIETSSGAALSGSDASVPPRSDEDLYQEETEAYEESVGVDRHLIVVISAVAAVVVVAVIILVAVLRSSGSRPAERPEGLRAQQQVTDTDSRPQPDGSDESYATSTSDLRLRLEPRQKHRMRIIREDKVSMTAMGQRQDISNIATSDLEFEVERIDANDIAWLKVTFLALREKGGSAAGQMEYDSTKPDVGVDNLLAPMYSSMIGKSFVMKVTPEGKMVGLRGIDELHLRMAQTIVENEDESIRKRTRERLTEGSEERVERTIERANQRYGSRDKREQAVQESIRKNPLFTEAKIEGMVGNMIQSLPGWSVEIGDSWQGMAVFAAVAPIDINLTFTLKEKKQGIAVVDISSKIQLVDEPASTSDSPLGPTRTSVTGSYKGSSQIDLSSGWMIHKKTTMRCSGEVIMAPSKQTPEGMTMPVSMESVTTVESIE